MWESEEEEGGRASSGEELVEILIQRKHLLLILPLDLNSWLEVNQTSDLKKTLGLRMGVRVCCYFNP